MLVVITESGHNSKMERDIYVDLLKWKSSTRRKPLILGGARQVGKTTILKMFGASEYSDTAYFNFEEDPRLNQLFSGKLEPERIIEKLSIYREKKISEGDTLVFFDEIQSSPNAINSLKYFNEKANAYHIVTAGSLLGVKIGQSAPFPVGKVNFMSLFPFSFGEYLNAMGKKSLRIMLTKDASLSPIDELFHCELIDHFKMYTYIGGMPEAISIYKKTKDLNEVRQVQLEILSAFEMDFNKYASPTQAIRIQAVWDSIPSQLTKENKKFKYSEIGKNARSRDYYEAIQWLTDAGLIYKSYNIKVPKLPLMAYREEGVFKLFFFETGLLSAKLEISQKSIIMGDLLFSEFKGALTENIVAQELMTPSRVRLYYWTNKSASEVDFILHIEDNILPLEVKAGYSRRKTSLHVYGEKYKPVTLLRTSPRNFKRDGHLCNIPLYSISNYRDLIGTSSGTFLD